MHPRRRSRSGPTAGASERRGGLSRWGAAATVRGGAVVEPWWRRGPGWPVRGARRHGGEPAAAGGDRGPDGAPATSEPGSPPGPSAPGPLPRVRSGRPDRPRGRGLPALSGELQGRRVHQGPQRPVQHVHAGRLAQRVAAAPDAGRGLALGAEQDDERNTSRTHRNWATRPGRNKARAGSAPMSSSGGTPGARSLPRDRWTSSPAPEGEAHPSRPAGKGRPGQADRRGSPVEEGERIENTALSSHGQYPVRGN